MGRGERKKESHKRAASSAKALVKIGAGIGATAVLGPLGPVALALVARLQEHAVGLFKEKRAQRIETFHQRLLSGVAEDERSAFAARLASDNDVAGHYASILEKVYQDDEAEKVELYASLLRHLVAGTREGATRGEELERHVIRSLRELSSYDVLTLRKILDLERAFPAKPPPMKTLPGGAVQIDEEKSKIANENYARHEQFIASLSPLEAAGLRRLEYAGLVHRADTVGGSRHDVTLIGLKLLTAVER